MRITVRPLEERDLAEADRICRLAFGTFLGLPDPLAFMGDASYVHTRWRTDPEAAFAAEVDGDLVGSNFATCWGSFGFFGPLTVRPDFWDKGVARSLLEPTLETFERRKTLHQGLFTFSQSPKHVALYGRFGFWPRFLTAVMGKPVEPGGPACGAARLSTTGDRAGFLESCRRVTDEVHPGLDLSREIEAVDEQRLGETLLLEERGRPAAIAVCHFGAGSEAGSGSCYVKFAAAAPGAGAEDRFRRLLGECEALAAEIGASSLVGGVNYGRAHACRLLAERGFRTILQGVAMHRPNEPIHTSADALVVDDWR